MTDTRDPRMHDGTWTGKRPEYLPPPQETPLQQAHAAADKAWTGLLDTAARTGQDSPINRDPRDIAAHVGGLADMANVENHPSTEMWARIIAYGLAGWCAAARAEELDISSGVGDFYCSPCGRYEPCIECRGAGDAA